MLYLKGLIDRDRIQAKNIPKYYNNYFISISYKSTERPQIQSKTHSLLSRGMVS